MKIKITIRKSFTALLTILIIINFLPSIYCQNVQGKAVAWWCPYCKKNYPMNVDAQQHACSVHNIGCPSNNKSSPLDNNSGSPPKKSGVFPPRKDNEQQNPSDNPKIDDEQERESNTPKKVDPNINVDPSKKDDGHEFDDFLKKKPILLRGVHNISEAGLKLIMKLEGGFQDKVYPDQGGYPTIGYGHLIKRGEDYSKGISEPEALNLLKSELENVANSINRLVATPLDQNQFDALSSYVFNTGSLNGTYLLEDLDAGDFPGAASEMDIITSNGKVVPDLIKRRKKEQILFLYGTY